MPTEITCHELLTFVGQYVAGQLSPPVHAAFEGHLADCPECVAFLNDFNAILRLAQGCRAEARPQALGVPDPLLNAVAASRTP